MELRCPSCQDKPLVEAGQTSRCEVCDGAWIAEETLVALLEQRASALVKLPWKPREGDQPMPCAQCKTPMAMLDLGDVKLDRCAQHGVWFDANELTALLKQSKRFKTEPGDEGASTNEHKGFLASLRELFKRS